MFLFLSGGNYQVDQQCFGGKCTKHGGPQETDLNVGISSFVSPVTCQFTHLRPCEYPAIC